MASGSDVLRLLRPDGGWVISADDFDSIRYDEGVVPLTKSQFDAGFAKADEAQIKAENDAIIAKQNALSKLAVLGLDEDDLKALGFNYA